MDGPDRLGTLSEDAVVAAVVVVWSLIAVGCFVAHWAMGLWWVGSSWALVWFAETELDEDDDPEDRSGRRGPF